MGLLTKNQANLTIIYLISTVAQFVGFAVITKGNMAWEWVPLLFIATFFSTIAYYKVFSD
jgi:hypothetical protein